MGGLFSENTKEVFFSFLSEIKNQPLRFFYDFIFRNFVFWYT